LDEGCGVVPAVLTLADRFDWKDCRLRHNISGVVDGVENIQKIVIVTSNGNDLAPRMTYILVYWNNVAYHTKVLLICSYSR
jgi:hypothetical protein